MTRTLCLFCKNDLPPKEGRVILPLLNHKNWTVCDGCGKRGPFHYAVKEPTDAGQAEPLSP